MNGALQHVKGIFTSGEGKYINEHGEEVYGKLPREKLENPFHILKSPTRLSEYAWGFDNIVERLC